MIQRRMLDDPEPASPEKQWRTVEDDGDLGAGLVLVPLGVGVHLGNHVLEEQQRTVIDGREPGAEASGKAHGLVLALHDVFLVLPLDAKGWVGHQVVESLALKAVAGLAVAEGVAEDNVGGVLVLDQHVRAADGPRFIVVLLAVERKLRALVLREDQLLGFGKHAAGAACRVVDGTEDAGFVDVLLAGVDEVGHQADDLARREVVPRLLVGLFVEAHDQMLEQVAHLKVVDLARVQIDLGHRLDDGEEAVAGVQLLDLIGELEALKNATRSRRKAVDVSDEIRRDILGVAKQSFEGVGAGVVEGMLAFRIGGLAQQALHGRLRHLLGLQLLQLLQNGVLGRLQDTIEPAQDDHGQHHQAILRRAIRSPEPVRDLPNFFLSVLRGSECSPVFALLSGRCH